MGLFDSIFNFTKEKGVKGDKATNSFFSDDKPLSEQELFDRFKGHFGHYTDSTFKSKFGTPSQSPQSNFKLTVSKPGIHFCTAATEAKKLGHDYFIFVGTGPNSGQAYYGDYLDDDYNLSTVDTSTPTAASYNVYPVFEPTKPTTNCTQVTESVANFYTKQVLTNMRSKLETDIKNIQERKKMTDVMVDAYKWCENNKQSSETIENCAKAQYQKNYKHIDSIENKEAQLKKLNDQLNVLRLKNRYEVESKNQLSNQNTKNDSFFSSIKTALTDNYNSVTSLNNSILNVSNKLKTNTRIFGMKTNVIGVLTTIVITLIVLTIGFMGYFAYQTAKKHFPFTLKGFRASQASASTPPSAPPSATPSTAPSTTPSALSNNKNPSTSTSNNTNTKSKNKKGYTGLGF